MKWQKLPAKALFLMSGGSQLNFPSLTFGSKVTPTSFQSFGDPVLDLKAQSLILSFLSFFFFSDPSR